ncbi:LamG-like jellyroll fold domain-containing protein [Lachnospiraceae bacterium 29-84]
MLQTEGKKEGKRKGGRKAWILPCGKRAFLSLFLALAVFVGSLPSMGVRVKAEVRSQERVFQHPGLLHSEESFVKMRENIDNQVSPNKETWDALWWNTYSNAGWNPRPLEGVTRGGTGDSINQLRIDVRRAYQNALIWKVSGDEEHGQAACRIINAWSSTMKWLGGNADRFLAAGLQGYELANIGEIMRDHPSFDNEGLKRLLLQVFYPMNEDFMIRHNDAYIGNYWANWELANLASMISIGVYCDRKDIYERALDYYKTGKGNGSIYHTMPYVFEEEGLAQWQESVRDQGHTTLGLVLCGVICETAWNQGDDLYGLSDNRFMKAVEYSVKYNSLGEEVPSAAYEYRQGKKGDSRWHAGINPYQRGSWRPIYAQMYNHYVNRKGLEMPNVKKMMEQADGVYMEGQAGNSLDELGWYTLTYSNSSGRREDTSIEGDLSDGVYRIVSASSGKSLVVNETGNLASAKKGTRRDEWWLLQNKGDGEYTITNMATGNRMQVNDEGETEMDGNTFSRYYAYGTQIGTGEADGSLAQSFAFLKENYGAYRIVPSLNFLVLALEGNSTADDARIVQWRNDAVGSYWNENNAGQRWNLEKATEVGTSFSFDSEETGFSTEYAQAEGSCSLASHGTGMAASFDGRGDVLEFTAKTGKSILAGEKAFTVSLEAKPEGSQSQWLFYAALDDKAQEGQDASYLGIWEEDGTVFVERRRQGEDCPALQAAVGTEGWRHISVAFAEKETVLYLNGEEAARAPSEVGVHEILGENSIVQVGANLGAGKYFKGQIDNVKLMGHAMTKGEALAEASAYVQGTLPETLVDLDFDSETDGFSGGIGKADGVYSLVDHGSGKALYLDGFRDYLEITGENGGSLIPGGLIKELTISLQVKYEGGTGWLCYAAPDPLSQNYGYERYLGLLDHNGSLTAERYDNQGSRLPSASGAYTANGWRHLALVLTESEIIVYHNGEEVARAANDTPLSRILGGDSIWQVGKANWGMGEYFKGMVDNYKIISRAWSAQEVRNEALKYVDKTALQAAVANATANEEHQYSAERFAAYQAALATAKAVLADGQALQSAVDPAANALDEVQAWMRLDEALFASVPETDEASYTAKTWAPYKEALDRAKEIHAAGTAAAQEATSSAQALRDMQSLLVSKPETIEEAIRRIRDIGVVALTPECSRKVILARKICSLLEESELEAVENLPLLEAAEAAMADYLLEFTFEDEETGLIGGQAVAKGEFAIQNGALYLDGDSAHWLDVKKADGSSLLTGREELTVSFGAKPETGGSNWLFYAAPNGDAPSVGYETYLGLLEANGTLTAERYKNTGERPASASAEADVSDWMYVTIVYTAEETILYINGAEASRAGSSIALPDILGEDGILQIGKANWGTGEYYKGWIDRIKILGIAMSPEEIKLEAEAFLDQVIRPEKVASVVEKINAIGTVSVSLESKAKIAQARAAYDALNTAEKSQVTNASILEAAEKAYQELLQQHNGIIADFSFYNEEYGLNGACAKAVAAGAGTPVFVQDAERGQVLSFDGTGESWLAVEKEDGAPLLSGVEELTVSYYSKAGRKETNWPFYAAPNGDAQVLNQESYLGILENNNNITAERFQNGRKPSASAAYQPGWNHIVVVYQEECTKVYVNGNLASSAENGSALKEILGTGSILQIGKANWGNGEFYKGLLDRFTIYNYALSEAEVEALEAKAEIDTRALEAKITEAKAIQPEGYTEESYQALQEAIHAAEAVASNAQTDEEVEKAQKELQEAIKGLEEKPKPEEPKPEEPEEPKPEEPKPEEPKKKLVEAISLASKNQKLAVGQSYTLAYTVLPKDAGNKKVRLTSSAPSIVGISGNKITAKAAGSAVITIASEDGSKVSASLTVTVRLQAVPSVKAVQENSKAIKVTVGKVAGAVGYDIYRSTKPGSGYKKIGTSKTVTYTDKKVKSGKTYYYKAAARSKNTAYNSAQSSKYAKRKALAPPSIKVKAGKSRKLSVTWKKAPGAQGYAVYASTKKTKGFRPVKVIGKGGAKGTSITAKKGVKSLYVKVRAFYKENGKKLYGPYAKTVRIKIR